MYCGGRGLVVAGEGMVNMPVHKNINGVYGAEYSGKLSISR
jgi:hypothetical protein